MRLSTIQRGISRRAKALSLLASSRPGQVDGRWLDQATHTFIVGCGRSGTTWLARLLARHPAVHATAESHGYNDVVEQADGLRQRRAAMAIVMRYLTVQQTKPWVGLHRYVDQFTFAAIIRSVVADGVPDADFGAEVLRRTYLQFLRGREAAHGDLFVEKTPGHLSRVERIASDFPTSKFIEVVRDGRDVAVSMDAFSATSNWVPTQRAAQFQTWRRAVERGEALRSSGLRERICVVRYEDLLDDAVSVLTDLLVFLELDASPSVIRLMIDRSKAKNAVFRGPGHAINRATSGGGKASLSSSDLELFERTCGRAARIHGYQ